jgi:hypothetical protein
MERVSFSVVQTSSQTGGDGWATKKIVRERKEERREWMENS